MKKSIVILVVLWLSGVAATQPARATGFSFDYTLGGHAVSIVDAYGNHPVWSEGVDPMGSFTLLGSGFNIQPTQLLWYNADQIRGASAAFGDASYGNAHFADGERLFRSIVIGRFGDRERSGATPVSLWL